MDNNELDAIQEMRERTESFNERINQFNRDFNKEDILKERIARLEENGFSLNEEPEPIQNEKFIPNEITPDNYYQINSPETASEPEPTIDEIVNMFEKSAEVTKQQEKDLLNDYLSNINLGEDFKEVEELPVEEPVQEQVSDEIKLEEVENKEKIQHENNEPTEEDLPFNKDELKDEELKEQIIERVVTEEKLCKETREAILQLAEGLIQTGEAIKKLFK